MTGQIEVEAFDPDERQLCPDGTCTGLIGPDGRCKECGRMAEGGVDVAEAVPAIPSPPAPLPEGEGGLEGEFAERQLCPDDTCIGLIGPDGRCKECGKPLASQAKAG